MDRRKFLSSLSAASVATIAGATTLTAKADALEDAMGERLGKQRMKPPGLCNIDGAIKRDRNDTRPYLQHDEPLLPKMPENPTLMDFYKLRFAPADHILQSARLARMNGENEKIILACLLHDICAFRLINTDHGYWCAQLVKPYVDEEVSWAIEKHQALRFFADESVGYEYPDAYIRFFGADYKIEPYLEKEHRNAKKHKWYMSARKITVNDLYSFEEGVEVEVEDFTDIIGRNFKQPKEGLGFDGSPTAHMWRSFIWPNNYL